MLGRWHFSLILAVIGQLACTGVLPAADAPRVLKDVAYKPNAGTDYERERCKLDLYLPQGGKGFATIVWFHGGGLQNGDKQTEIAVNLAERFAKDGVAVASVNYRLSPKAKYPAYIDDAAAAIAFVLDNIEKHGGSAKRVFVSGHSAGGYLTAMVGLDGQHLKKYGHVPADLAGLMPIAGQMITHSTVREERDIPRTRPLIDEAAPLFHIAQDAPPTLAIAGSNDLPARAEENRYFVAAMKAAGHKDVTYFEVAGRDHGTIASRTGEADDEVAAAMLAMIKRLRE
jgi:acetyl esterase/lipase